MSRHDFVFPTDSGHLGTMFLFFPRGAAVVRVVRWKTTDAHQGAWPADSSKHSNLLLNSDNDLGRPQIAPHPLMVFACHETSIHYTCTGRLPPPLRATDTRHSRDFWPPIQKNTSGSLPAAVFGQPIRVEQRWKAVIRVIYASRGIGRPPGCVTWTSGSSMRTHSLPGEGGPAPSFTSFN